MTIQDTRDHGGKLRTSDNASDPAVTWKVKCLNCGAALVGPFCAECGQRAIPARPTVRDLVGDALAEFSGWDGKFAETIRTLLRRPGELTRQWLDGRRVSFISPLRLYLTASLLYFVAASASPNVLRPKSSRITVGPVDVTTGALKSRPQQVGDAASKALTTGKGLVGAERDSVLREIARAPWLMRPLMTKAVDEPGAVVAGILRWMPRTLFALIPIYAGILALFYRRRHYPEHLYYAIHFHAFVFIALGIANVVKFAQIFWLAAVVQVAMTIWIVVYAVQGLRRVYGGSVGVTVAKGIGIMLVYGLVALPAVTLAVLLSAF